MGDLQGWYILGIVIGGASLLLYLLDKAEKRGAWKSEVNTDREKFSTFMVEVDKKLNKISNQLEKFRRRLSKTAEIQSPAQLTPLGEKVSKSIDAKKWVEETAPLMRNRVRRKTSYEVQDICYDFVKGASFYETRSASPGTFTPPGYLNLHQLYGCAFENGISLDEVLDVLAIELRNYILDRKEEFNITS